MVIAKKKYHIRDNFEPYLFTFMIILHVSLVSYTTGARDQLARCARCRFRATSRYNWPETDHIEPFGRGEQS